jgi:hypothetical protein
MGRALVLFGIVLLSACTTPNDLARQPPTIAFDTPAKVADIRDCITARNTYLTLMPFQDGWQFLQEEHGGDFAIFSLQLRPSPVGTHVELRLGKTLGQATYEQAVRPCIDNLPRSQ